MVFLRATRRVFLLTVFFVVIGAMLSVSASSGDQVVIKDITGRVVTLPRPAKRIVLAEGRQIIALALIHPDPVSLLAGWLGDFRKNDKQTYELFREKFPGIDKVTVLGLSSDGTFSVEQTIALHPDVVVLGVSFAAGSRSNEVARQIEAAGIPVVFTDFVLDPLNHTVPSMRILGQVIGRETKANEFSIFYEQHMRSIVDRLAKGVDQKRPPVLVETHAGMAECCFAPGHQGIGLLIEAAGVDSISAHVVPGAAGHLDREYIISSDPEMYIATGGSHLEAVGGLVIGPGYSRDMILERLRKVSHRIGIAGTKAVLSGRVHGIFHNLLTTPLNILAVENIAKWGHPVLFSDIDPEKTEAEINRRFFAIPMRGIYWISLNGE